MKRLSILLLLIVILGNHVFAYDFMVNGIGYTVISFEDLTVSVDGIDDSINGTIDIPSTIIYSDRIFTVTKIQSMQNDRIETVNIPSTVKEIGSYAFSNSSISSINIPANVEQIGGGAFSNCTKLQRVILPSCISKLQDNTFYGCKNLTELEWHPSGTSKILGRVFYNCSSLKTIRIPAKVSIIGGPEYTAYVDDRVSAFQNCSSLDSLIIEDGKGDLILKDDHEKSGNEPYDTGYHGEFYGSKVNYVYMGRAIKLYEWASYQPVLRYVEHLVIGDSVENVSIWLPNQRNTYPQKSLKTLTIGKSLKKVGSIGNETLEYIRMRCLTPPTAEEFSNYNYINTILYVPVGSKTAYQTANIWKKFFNIVEYNMEDGDSSIKKCAMPQISYSDGKLVFYSDTEDANFISSITDADIKTYTENTIQLSATYTINVYAAKTGFENSDVATATLCWIDVDPRTEGITNSVAQIPSKAVLIQSDNGHIHISGIDDYTRVYAYATNGQQMGTAISHNGYANITTNIKSGDIAIVKIGDRSFKVIVK